MKKYSYQCILTWWHLIKTSLSYALCTLKQEVDDAENEDAKRRHSKNANIIVQFNALYKNKDYAVMKCD